MTRHHALLIATAALCLASATHAATIYRCGAAGNVYSDQPCMDGRIVAANDERSDAQRAEGLRIAAFDRRWALELQRERLQQDRLTPARAGNLGPGPAPVIVRMSELQHAKKHAAKRKDLRLAGRETDFVAYAPATVKGSRR